MSEDNFSPGHGWVVYKPGRREYPELSPILRTQLASVRPSGDKMISYKPCRVRLIDGRTVDQVYVQDAASYIRVWGAWPDEDRGKSSIDISQVTAIEESPNRLPPEFANVLYGAGESGMGYFVFTLVFSDRSRQVYNTGNAIDFLPYPEGKGPGDTVRVLPHKGRNATNVMDGLNYHWCLYGIGEGDHESWRRDA